MCESTTKQPSEALVLERDILDLRLVPSYYQAIAIGETSRARGILDSIAVVRDALLRVSPEYRKWKYLFGWPDVVDGAITDARLLAWLRSDDKVYICVICLTECVTPIPLCPTPGCGRDFVIPKFPLL